MDQPNCEAARGRVTELLARHDTLNRELFDEQLRFSRECNKSAADLGDLTIPMTAAARAELGLPFDAEAYAAIVGEARRAADSDLEAFIERLRATIADTQHCRRERGAVCLSLRQASRDMSCPGGRHRTCSFELRERTGGPTSRARDAVCGRRLCTDQALATF
jgi:hypothetical protein